MGSLETPLPMHVPRRQSHSLLLPLAWEGTTSRQATTQAIMQSTLILRPTAWERFSSRTPVEHARGHSLAHSLGTHVTCSPWHIKGRIWVLSKGQALACLLLPLPFPLERSPLLQPPATRGSKTTETWELLSLSPICNP
jgi:hypothetical protein